MPERNDGELRSGSLVVSEYSNSKPIMASDIPREAPRTGRLDGDFADPQKAVKSAEAGRGVAIIPAIVIAKIKSKWRCRFIFVSGIVEFLTLPVK